MSNSNSAVTPQKLPLRYTLGAKFLIYVVVMLCCVQCGTATQAPANDDSVAAMMRSIISASQQHKKEEEAAPNTAHIDLYKSDLGHDSAAQESRLDCQVRGVLDQVALYSVALEIARACALEFAIDIEQSNKVTGNFSNQEGLGMITKLAKVGGHMVIMHKSGWLLSDVNKAAGLFSDGEGLISLPLQHSKAAAILPELQRHFTERNITVWLQANEASNSIIANVDPALKQVLQEHIALIDKPLPLFMLEAWIMEVTETAHLQSGIAFSGQSAIGINNSLSVATPPGQDGLFEVGISAQNSSDVLLNLQALSQANGTHILANPRIFSLQGETATLFQGEEIPYQVSTETQLQTEFRRAGLSLEVTPYRLNRRDVELAVKVNKDSVAQTSANQPSISRREINTKVRTTLGNTLVISGIRTDRSGTGATTAGILPFGSQNKTDERRQLLIFLTVSVVEG